MPPWSMQSTNKSIPNGAYQIYCLKLLILIAPNIHYLGINDKFQWKYHIQLMLYIFMEHFINNQIKNKRIRFTDK